MNRVDKYQAYFTAQANGKIPRQRGGGGLSLNKVLEWTKKVCDIASSASRIVSPVQQVAEQVESSLKQDPINTKGSGSNKQTVKKRCRKNTYQVSPHKLVKRYRK